MLDSIDERLHGISTLISCTWADEGCSGSGFFFKKLENKGPKEENDSKAGYVRIDEFFLVTNRHVLVNERNELATSMTFHHRKMTTKGYLITLESKWHLV